MTALKPFRDNYYLWHYVPSLPASVIFIVCFFTMTCLHIYRLFKTRTWFCVPFTIGGIFEFVGYAARAAASSNTDLIMPYVIQNIFILLPPALFAASIYMALGRLIRSVNAAHLSVVPIRWLTRLFVLCDILSFVIQGNSAPLMFISDGKYAKWGNVIVIGGLCVQLIAFGLFVVTILIFDGCISRSPTLECLTSGVPWKQCLRMLYAVSALIVARSVFRIVEYIEGQDGYFLSHEWPLYPFDAVLMLKVMVIFYVWYPSGVCLEFARISEESLELSSVSIGSDQLSKLHFRTG